MKKKFLAVSITVVFFALFCFGCTHPTLLDEKTNIAETSYKVIRAVDGDTLIVNIDGEETRVRMIGIDTPESVHSDETRNCEFGKTASEYTKTLLEGEYVGLEYDVERTDQYDRVLAYVYLDGEMVNETLVEEGYAVAKEYPPNSKYAEVFEEAQKLAELHKNGMWSNSITDQQTGGMKEEYALEIAS